MELATFGQRFRETFPDLVGQRVLVAVSGGGDSVALLHLLLAPSLGLELEVVHVHHGARGAEADADQEFCAGLARGLGLAFHARRLAAEPSPPEGREAGWRRARYRELSELARLRGASAVATGHQRDDIAEGVLVQLLRGAGPRALAGIAARTPTGFVRPLLHLRRAELRGWLETRGLPWREDSSNRDPSHLRSRVRHEVMPDLEAISPRIVEHLVRLAAALAEDEAHLADRARPLVGGLDPWDPRGGIDVEPLADAGRAVRARWLHAEAERFGIGPATRRQLELLHGMVEGGAPPAVVLGGRWRLRRARGRLWLEPPAPPAAWATRIREGETVAIGVPGWEARLGAAATGSARFRARVPRGLPTLVRSPLPGDRVAGGEGEERVSRLLARELPRHLRSAWPVVLVNATIHWIPGVWLDPNAGNGGVEMEVDRP